VLAVTGRGESLAKAKLRAYSAVKEIRWPGGWCRKDISDKAFDHERRIAAAGVATSAPQPEIGG
jgi:phosphoribosylamine--glycine ligase